MACGPKKSRDVDSAGVYFMSVEEFEGRPLERPRAASSPAESKEPDAAEADFSDSDASAPAPSSENGD
jgi:hypothetical protein